MKRKVQQFVRLSFFIFVLTIFGSMQANNIRINYKGTSTSATNPQGDPVKPRLVNKNTVNGTVFISFPLAWDNSWKSNKPNNHDAAWVFCKFREGGNEWRHVYIDTNEGVHYTYAADGVNTKLKVGTSNVEVGKTSGGVPIIETKGLGVFVYRQDNGKGSIYFDSISLKWNYRAQDLDDESVVSLRVYAIEMVYVPGGGFDVGDGNYTGTGALSYKVSGNEIHGSAAGILRIDTVWKSNIASPSDYMYYYNGPSTGQNTIINPGRMNSSYVSFPLGNYNSGQTNIAGYSNYQERYHAGTPHQLDAYRTFVPWSSGQLNHFPLRLSAWSGTNSSAYGWYSITVKLPQPFRATNFVLGWWSGYYINGFSIRGSNDMVNWDVILGSYNSTSCPGGNNCGNGSDGSLRVWPSNQTKSYSAYEWRWYTSNGTGMLLCGFGIADRTNGGHPDNGWYYGRGSRIIDHVDTIWKASPPIGTQKTYPSNVPMPFRYMQVGPARNIVSSPTYPNGQSAYYVMKHELSQHAYVDFLNSLTVAQQTARAWNATPISATNTRFNTATNTCRNFVCIETPSTGGPALYNTNISTLPTGQWNRELAGGNIAMCYLNWADNAAYLCWAGLRPLTELEYEKAARGTAPSVLGEYAWGNTSVLGHTGLSNPNAYNELATPGYSNYIQFRGDGDKDIFPARVGCLATATSTRTDAGASFYGVLNLSDNVPEMYINASTTEGLKFTGEHGSGNLDGNGNASIVFWPEPSTAAGAGIRGACINGAMGSGALDGQISNRKNAEASDFIKNRSTSSPLGCRGGRTAPKGNVY